MSLIDPTVSNCITDSSVNSRGNKEREDLRARLVIPFLSRAPPIYNFPANVPRNVINGFVDNDPSCLFCRPSDK